MVYNWYHYEKFPNPKIILIITWVILLLKNNKDFLIFYPYLKANIAEIVIHIIGFSLYNRLLIITLTFSYNHFIFLNNIVK